MTIGSWPVGTTKAFSGTVTIGGVAPNIASDTVTLRLKTNKTDADAAAVVSKNADCATSGAGGTYLMEIAPADTAAVAPGKYHYDIVLYRTTGAEYVLETGQVALLDRVSDP